MYAKVIDGEVIKYPYSLQELYEDNPNVGFPVHLTEDILSRFNTVQVIITGHPEYNQRIQKVVEGVPFFSAMRGRWEQSWVLLDKTPEEVALEDEVKAGEARTQRNTLLSACDWTQLNDTPLTDDQKVAWGTYRKSLRDITDQPGFPWDIQWPEEPNGG